MRRRLLITTLAALTAAGALPASSFAAQREQARPPRGQVPPAPQGGMMGPPREGTPQGEMQQHMGPGMPHMPQGEAPRPPHGYMPPQRPEGIENRPMLNRNIFNHNFQAQRGHRIGPYHGPEGWEYRRWRFGEILPPPFWTEQYWLGDYWLFGLDVPPPGCEWVRYGPDALLVDISTGEIIQVVYGAFL